MTLSSTCERLLTGFDVAANVAALVPLTAGLLGFATVKIGHAVVREAVNHARAR